jgi:hypothetical protein
MLVSRGRDSSVHAKIDDIFAEGDKVAVRWTYNGIYRGEPRSGYPKPGERIVLGSMSIYRLRVRRKGRPHFTPLGSRWCR